jgi:hypothetical protein
VNIKISENEMGPNLTTSPIAILLILMRVSSLSTTTDLAANIYPLKVSRLGLTLARVSFGSVLSGGYPGVELVLVDAVVALPVTEVMVTFFVHDLVVPPVAVVIVDLGAVVVTELAIAVAPSNAALLWWCLQQLIQSWKSFSEKGRSRRGRCGMGRVLGQG